MTGSITAGLTCVLHVCICLSLSVQRIAMIGVHFSTAVLLSLCAVVTNCEVIANSAQNRLFGSMFNRIASVGSSCTSFSSQLFNSSAYMQFCPCPAYQLLCNTLMGLLEGVCLWCDAVWMSSAALLHVLVSLYLRTLPLLTMFKPKTEPKRSALSRTPHFYPWNFRGGIGKPCRAYVGTLAVCSLGLICSAVPAISIVFHQVCRTELLERHLQFALCFSCSYADT